MVRQILAALEHCTGLIQNWKLTEIKLRMMDRRVRLSNGVISPQIFLGTFRIKTESEVRTAVETAVSLGYRGLDTASVYKNHSKIARTLTEVLPRLGLTRADIFLTSKLAPVDQGTERCRAAVSQILSDLNTDYLDLFLIHWPGVQNVDVQSPVNSKLRLESWRVLEEYYQQGKFRSIGVSNYTAGHLTELLASCSVVPHVLQTELHPHYQQQALVQLCHHHNIHVQAYSSLGQQGAASPLFRSPVVRDIAETLNRSPAQILLQWALTQGYSIMPKSVHQERIKENFELNFSLSDNQMSMLNSLEKDVCEKYAWDPTSVV